MSPGLLLSSFHDSLALSWSSVAVAIVVTLLTVGQSAFCLAVRELTQNPTPKNKTKNPNRITAGKISENRFHMLK